MPNTASPQVMSCYERAIEARELALKTDDPLYRNDFFACEKRWLRLAQSCEFSERLTQFLQRPRAFTAHPVFTSRGVPTASQGLQMRLVRHPARTGKEVREFDRWRIAVELVQRLREAGIDCQLSDGFQTVTSPSVLKKNRPKFIATFFGLMSALGQKQTFAPQKVMSALPSKADMCGAASDVRFGPTADIRRHEKSIKSRPALSHVRFGS